MNGFMSATQEAGSAFDARWEYRQSAVQVVKLVFYIAKVDLVSSRGIARRYEILFTIRDLAT